MKLCSRCGKNKHLNQFKSSDLYSDGKHCWCVDCNKAYKRDYYQLNKKKMDEASKKWRENNLDRSNEIHKKYCNSEKRRAVLKKYKSKMMKDPKYRLSNSMGCSMRDALTGRKNGVHWESIVGYTVEDLKNHIESQFKQGMTWENYGEWEIDHILPVCSFNFVSIQDDSFRECWDLKNLQPLWARENCSKGSKIVS